MFSNDGVLAIVGDFLVDISKQSQMLWQKNNNFNSNSSNASFSSNNKFIVTSTRNGDIALINALDGSKNISTSGKHNSVIRDSFVGLDNKYLYTVGISGIKSWDIKTGTVVNSIDNIGQMNDLAYGSNSLFLRNCNLTRYDYNTGSVKYKSSRSNCIGGIVSSKNDNYVATNDFNNASISLYSGINLSAILNVNVHPNSNIKSMIISNDERYLISSGFDNVIKIFDLAAKQVVRTINMVNSPNYFVSFNNKNELIYLGDGGLKSLDIVSGKEQNISQNISLQNFCTSPNDDQLAGNTGRQILNIFNLKTKQLLMEKTFPHSIVKIQYNSSGSQIFITTEKEFHIIPSPK